MVKKLNGIKVEEKLKSLGMSVFSPREFRDVFNVSQNTASVFILRNTKSGLFIKLRNSYYMLKDSNPSLYFIANKLYQPSYISLEKALSYYNIIPETVYTITSITSKPTREYTNQTGVFSYQRIKKSAFTGYNPVKIESNLVLFAEPEKALTDYLYFVDLKRISFNDRIELKGIKKNKLLQYAKLFKRKSLLNLVEQVYAAENVVREYCQHLFLSYLYQNPGSEKLLFKGGTALRVILKSPRYSEDLDFTGSNISHKKVEALFADSLANIERTGIEVDITEGKTTTGGYLGKAAFSAYEIKTSIQIEISLRNGRDIKGARALIENDYIQSYTLVHLSIENIIKEKMAALFMRQKPRDFYDYFYLLSGNYPLVKDKENLRKVLILMKESKINFREELKKFLPASHAMHLRDFRKTLEQKILSYLGKN